MREVVPEVVTVRCDRCKKVIPATVRDFTTLRAEYNYTIMDGGAWGHTRVIDLCVYCSRAFDTFIEDAER